MGRPTSYPDKTIVGISGNTAKSKLQAESQNRAIIDVIIDKGGRMAIGAICKHFGFDNRAKIYGLIAAGWLIRCE